MMGATLPNLPEWALLPSEGVAVPFVKSAQEQARLQFLQLGLPTSRNEEWKYTNVSALAQIPFRRGERAAAQHTFPDWGPRAVFVNGFEDKKASNLSALPPGVRVESLTSASPELARLSEVHFNRHVAWQKEPFTALNTAHLCNALIVHVARGVRAEVPIHLVFHSVPSNQGATSSFVRVLVLLEENTEVSLIEDFSGEPGTYFTNAVTEIVLGSGARLDYSRLQREDADSFHVSSMGVCQEQDSAFNAKIMSFGGALARQDFDVRLVGKGAECSLSGFFIAENKQHLDTNLKVEHRSAHTRSVQNMKGIAGHETTGVFEGQIFVEKDAQKTDAVQNSKNLLLSPGAHIYTKPALEIYANDVKCSHGATVGELDPDAVFFLRARGISESEARSLLTHAFLTGVVSSLTSAPMRAEIERLVREKLWSLMEERTA